jgi:hypothetical protein
MSIGGNIVPSGDKRRKHNFGKKRKKKKMPKVGKKKFSYSKAGKAAAKRYAKKTGKKVKRAKKKRY